MTFAAGHGWLAYGLVLALLAWAPPCSARDIYLLMGQSNMSGRGAIGDLTAVERLPDPRISLFANDGRWRAALDPLDDTVGQTDAVSADDNAAVGPGLFFARAMEGPIGLVPCAKGGSAITHWAPDQERSSLYGSCMARARKAAKRGRIAGIIWYQGESDARTPELAQAWHPAFLSLVEHMRRDLGRPNLPLVVIALADAPEVIENANKYPAWSHVQAAQQSLFLPHMALVSAQGLPRDVDGLHLTTAAYRTLGPMLASAMRAIASRTKSKRYR
jgi:hypothetical protein